jgi:peptide/nickel transport system permease protein
MSTSTISWRRWALARLGQLALVVAGVLIATFLLIHLVPGDPAKTLLGTHATPESIAALRAEMKLDEPFPRQFWFFVRGSATGDLGSSLVQSGRPVTHIVLPALGVTLLLTAAAVLISVLVGLSLGLTAALTRIPALDTAIRGLSAILLAMPPFLIGFFLLIFVSLRAGLAPAGGWGSSAVDDLRYVWLPALALSGYLIPVITRAVRQSARETAEQHFIEAALARGLRPSQIVRRHVLPNSLLPVITLVGLNTAGLIGGAVVIEAVFNLPGMGTALVQAVGSRDYPVIQGVALVTGVLVVVITFLTDLLYLIVDPRTRLAPA